MSIWWTVVTVLILILPALCQVIKTTCEIPSVEEGDVATLTIHFGDDLIQKQERDLQVKHLDHNDKETKLLSCSFSNGTVECDKTPCCTPRESKVTDVLSVYIHNASQQLEGKFWGFVIPGDTTYQKYCNFTLKASTCHTDDINATNSHMTCNNQSVTIGQSCTVICNSDHNFQGNQNSVMYTCVGRNKWSPEIPYTSCKASTCPTDYINATNSYMTCSNKSVTIDQSCTVICNSGHSFQENQKSVTYTCVGRNKWSPEIRDTSCEPSTCPTDDINATNSHMTCSNQSVTISQSCTVICNSGHSFQENQKSVTYTCVGRNKWSPEIPYTSCELHSKDQKAQNLYFLFLLLSALPIITVVVILFKRRHKEKTKRRHKEDPLLPLKSTELKLHDQASPQSAEDYWLECIRTWYPELQSITYFLPPFHFNRVLYDVQIVAGNPVLVPQNPQDSDVRDVRALERVLQYLRALADDPLQKEVMMVVSQLQFGKYLGEPSYAAAAALLPSSNPLPEEFLRQRYDKGDCDVLIIHSKLGLLTLEIKSVGGNFSQQEMTEQEQDDMVMKEVKKAVEQLNKAEVVLKHITSECIATTHITKILVLPNIKSIQLLRAVNRTPDLQFLCQCFGVQNVDDAVKLCLLSDQLSDKHMSSDENHSSNQALREWWLYIVKASGPEQLMTSSLYEQLVARFCGPATTVEVHCVTAPRLNIRTLGEAVSETGERVARLVLFPQQVDILNQSPLRAFLSGPPGTGKTIVLIMQGLTWLQRGHDVHVVSTWDESRAATTVIEHQLQETAKTSTAKQRVHRYQFDFKKDGEVETAVRRLKSLSEGRQLCVIADEVVRDYDRELFTEFCDQLIVQVPGVFIWGATVHHDVRPLCLEEVKLTTPLRSPPVVVREVMESVEIKDKVVHNYTVSDVPVPTDGPPVMRIKHRDGQSGHTGRLPHDCVECGHQVARVLTELDVGRTGDSNGPPPLQYRDVLVLCNGYPTDDRVKSFGLKTTTASGLVRGLRDRHVPVRVVEKGDEAAIRDTALGVGDLVTVANWRDVQGLERKVVVVEKQFRIFGRLLAMSRCTSQLVMIDCLLV